MRKLLFALFVASVLTVGAQGLISPHAKMLKQRYEKSMAKARTRGQMVSDDARGAFFVTCQNIADARSVADALTAKGADVCIVKGRLIVLDMPLTRLDDLAATEGVAKVELGPRISPKTDNTRRVTQAVECNAGTAPQLPQAYTGKDIIVGLIDIGFDPTHPMFKDQDGNLRIKGLYMPGNTTLDGEKVTIGGKIYTGSYFSKPEDILDTMKVKYSHEMTHGTHCLSIAAGSIMPDVKGLSGEPLGGVAPEADILLCDYSSDGAHREEMWRMGYDVLAKNIAESVEFMVDQAKKAQKPLVVSLSSNSHDGWHDGTSNMATLLGNFCKDEGLALMLCAGNEGGDYTYVNKIIAPRDTFNLGFFPTIDEQASAFCCLTTAKRVKMKMSIYDKVKKKELYRLPVMAESDDEHNQEIYYDMADADDSSLTLKDRLVYKNLKNYMKEGLIYAACYKSIGYDKNDKEYDCTYVELIHQDVKWSDDAYTEDGKFRYSFMLHLIPTEETELHSWGDYYDLFYYDETGKLENGSPALSVGDWNTSGEPVSVGAWVANNKLQEEGDTVRVSKEDIGSISWFSSYGTDLAGHKHPDVCAPGSFVAGAYSSFIQDNTEDYTVYVRKAYENQFVGQTAPRDYLWGWLSGTSMSTPAAAGVVALWMQAAKDKGKTLNCTDIKDIIAHSCDTDEYTEKLAHRFGHGKINAYKGLLYVLGIDTAIQGLSKNQPKNVSFRVANDLLYADGAEDGTPVTLYDLSGVPVRQTTVQNGTIGLAGLPKGVYAVQLGKLGSTLIRK